MYCIKDLNMKKEILSGLAIATISALPIQALNFGTGNVYDKYWAGESISIQGTPNDKLKDTKLLPDKPILQPIQVPNQEIMMKYGVPYPVIIKPIGPIYETKYGIPYPRENMENLDKFNVPVTKYGINLPK